VEKSRRGDNPCPGRQITAPYTLDVPDPSRLPLFQEPERNKEKRIF
jgi:hypothetical protein